MNQQLERDYCRAAYEQYLQGPVNYGGRGPRPRVRHIEKWIEFKSRLPHGSELDLDEFEYRTGRKLWVWSDHHFGHRNIIRFSDRPFADLIEMREHMIANYQDYVGPDDVCIFVGDIAFLPDDEANKILHRMHGYKILIIGNHDWNKKKVKKLHFDETHLIKRMYVDGMDFVFTHYPMNTLPEPYFIVHGHEHISHQETNSIQHFNVNVEFTGYKPRAFSEIVEEAKKRIINMEY